MLKTFDEWLYNFLKNKVEEMPIRLVKMVAYYYTDARIRKLYWRRLGVIMGDGTYANLGLCVVPNDNKICVMIGDNVSISPNVTFVCCESANNGNRINRISYVTENITREGNIVVEDDVWIGANVTILSGVRVGTCSVIGAGSVVTKDIEAYSIYAGVPAKKIRDLSGEKEV